MIIKNAFPRFEYPAKVLAVAAMYFAAGKIGLAVPFTSGNVSPVWPASGVALAAVLLWGQSVFPGIALGAFLVNFMSPMPAPASAGLGVGNMASALFGGYLVKRFGVRLATLRLRDVWGLTGIAIASPVIAATVGTTTLFLANVQPWSHFASAWKVWWLGDAMGVLIVTPLFFIKWQFARRIRKKRWVEFVALLAGLLAACFIIFGPTGLAIQDDVLAFAVFPFVIWAALRFRTGGVLVATFLIAAIAVWGTGTGYGPFVRHSPLHNAILLQFFIAVTAMTGLVLASVIAERLQTQEKLRERSELLDLANDSIFVRTLDDKIQYWNKGAERLYGWSQEEAVGRPVHELLATEFPQPFSEITEQLFRDGSWRGELTQSTRDGNRISVASRWSVWQDREGKPQGFLELNTDITARKRAEEGLRALSGQLLKLQDEERRRIARELHDSAGQTVVALNINLSAIQSEAQKLGARAARACQESVQLLHELSEELRTLSRLLHPPLLDEAGLPPAIDWYVETFAARSKIVVDLEISPELGRHSPDLETTIFRLVQECLTNIHRHSGSRTASIRIDRTRDEVRVKVSDHGRGMPEHVTSDATRSTAGIGIQGMRERVGLLGGRLEIHSGKDGTVVLATLPAVDRVDLNASESLASRNSA